MRGASLEPLPSVLLPRQLLCPLKRRPRVSLNHHTADADVGDAGRNFDVSVIEIPLDLRMKVLPIPYINPYVMIGPMVALPQGAAGTPSHAGPLFGCLRPARSEAFDDGFPVP